VGVRETVREKLSEGEGWSRWRHRVAFGDRAVENREEDEGRGRAVGLI
jgi:hypothetical protein